MNPLGEFQGLKSVGSFASESFVEIFQDILIDLPVGSYFRSFIDNLIAQIQVGDGDKAGGVSMEDISKKFSDFTNTETNVFIRKIWLIQFHRYIMAHCNGST